MLCALPARCGAPSPGSGRWAWPVRAPSPTLCCGQAVPALSKAFFSPSLLIMVFCKCLVVFLFLNQVFFFFFFLCFSHSHPNLTSNFSLPVSGPGSSVPKSLHLPSVSHSVLRNRRWERARTQGQPTKQSALCGAGCWVLGAVGVWGNAVSRFARKLGKL